MWDVSFRIGRLQAGAKVLNYKVKNFAFETDLPVLIKDQFRKLEHVLPNSLLA